MFWLRLALFLAPILAAGLGGWALRDGQAAKAQVQEDRQVAAYRGASQGQADAAGAAYAVQAQALAARTVTIEKRIPVYVTREAAAGCVVPNGFVRLLNDAARGEPSSPAPGRADDAPAGLGLDPVADVTAGNLLKCRANSQKLSALQQFERDQDALAATVH